MSCTMLKGFKALPLPMSQLSLAAVLKCGQSFRWTAHPLYPAGTTSIAEPTHEYRYCLRDRVVCLRQSADTLFYRSVYPDILNGISSAPESSGDHEKRDLETLAFLRDYFQLDIDLATLYDYWSNRDPVFKGVRDRFTGLRMLRQDPWETIVSFICSSNNNISRITKMVQSLSTHFSPALVSISTPTIQGATDVEGEEDISYHAFPPPSVLAAPSVSAKLRSLGFGYRAEYIQRTAEMLIDEHGSDREVQKWLLGLRNMSTDDARTELLKFVGVGRKVADCILLMCLDKREVVPVDTHVHQIAMKYYGVRGKAGTKLPMTPKLYDEVNDKLANIWGDFAGWAHSVLFTADLRSFSSFGLPSPSPSPIKEIRESTVKLPPTPSPSPRKRMRRDRVEDNLQKAENVLSGLSEFADVSTLDGDMADRVKKRRRVAAIRRPVTMSDLSEW
ncbi:DNA glycosylase [Rickenella mellea]|uniref:DNA-(apurinic or apyrimidinic site) lyase n=1 Tax=Rickenella mellea TaxID=50990 RepID=A0A4Y7QAY0_9AGAM|nr:DNA glycosylase [Rickenella mellea]